MGVSLRAYARHRGVSDTAVRKAIKSGRIQTESDGTIDVAKVDRQWERNTDRAQQRASSAKTKAVPKAALDAVADTLNENGHAGSGTTYMQARIANEVLKAQTNRIKLQQLKKELVDRNRALAQVFTLARAERDAWLNWPTRISSRLAAELGVDTHRLHSLLEQEVRQHLQALGDPTPKVD